jgi:hypothetical protein
VQRWANIIDFTDAASKAAFQKLALDAIDRGVQGKEDA